LFVLLTVVSGFAPGAAGYWNSTTMVNNISSPILRSAIVSSIAAGAGHIAGGTTANLIAGQNFGDAFANSFEGIGKSMAIGGAIGVATTIGVSYANGINPWTGNKIQAKTFQGEYNFNSDPNGDNVTLYRGTTGSENGNGPLFMTENPNYAAQYVQNGGRVMEITIPRSTLFLMEQNGVLTYKTGLYYGSNQSFREYVFSPLVKSLILNR
jgi:hypothetical protein